MNSKSTQKEKNSKITNNREEADSNGDNLVKISVLGVGLTNETQENILEYIVKNLSQQSKSYYIVTPNPEMIVLANKNKDFKTILNNAKIALTDGMQLYRYARWVGIPLKERIIGTNFVEKLCEKVSIWPITVGFLGGRGEIAERASECLRLKYPKLKIVYIGSEWDEAHTVLGREYLVSSSSYLGKNKLPNTKYKIPNTNTIDILFVAFGFPRQEKWMSEHVGKIPVKVMMGVGGALDQIVDPTLRPPMLIHQLGMGWLYRLVREPWRIKRQLKLVEFIQLAFKNKP